ncbi:hypothetical protein DFH08DRAFT_821289 [Mycena albidolilacea]|uniref:Uncharacterized protein n=1 Tax=Mycena albidolilacea TaxID=1033008 RepID=A0AAD6ZAL6_9AGAR|nr:hypothetical protein DFH08DRAFT_821289 [Mycena albidolilacea]
MFFSTYVYHGIARFGTRLPPGPLRTRHPPWPGTPHARTHQWGQCTSHRRQLRVSMRAIGRDPGRAEEHALAPLRQSTTAQGTAEASKLLPEIMAQGAASQRLGRGAGEWPQLTGNVPKETLAGREALTTRPELIQPLRDEAERVFEREGWTKNALNKMIKMDSFLRETQRLHTMCPNSKYR